MLVKCQTLNSKIATFPVKIFLVFANFSSRLTVVNKPLAYENANGTPSLFTSVNFSLSKGNEIIVALT